MYVTGEGYFGLDIRVVLGSTSVCSSDYSSQSNLPGKTEDFKGKVMDCRVNKPSLMSLHMALVHATDLLTVLRPQLPSMLVHEDHRFGSSLSGLSERTGKGLVLDLRQCHLRDKLSPLFGSDRGRNQHDVPSRP